MYTCEYCLKHIVKGEVYVSFKVPGTDFYVYLHLRSRNDCWHKWAKNFWDNNPIEEFPV